MKTIISIVAIIIVVLIFPFNSKAGKTKIPSQKTDTITLNSQQIQSIQIRCYAPRESKNNELRNPKVINSDSVFNNFFYNNCESKLPIDFSKNTLLYFPTRSGGCRAADYIRTIQIIDNTVIYHVHIKQHGYCKILIHNTNEVLIPKIKKQDIVKFIVTKSHEHPLR